MLDSNGEGIVELPYWYETLNTSFRYQLTAIGSHSAEIYVKQEIENNQFVIGCGKPQQKISWQITGDPAAKANPLVVEKDKPQNERSYYLNPELYNQPVERGLHIEKKMQLLT